MTPAEYAQEIVLPTVQEFLADGMSRRRGYLACVVVYHLRDHLAEAAAPLTGDPKRDRRLVEAEAEKVDATVRAALSPGSDAFDVVRGVANGSKHGLTRSPHAVPFTAGNDESWLGGPCGGALSLDMGGWVEIPHEGRRLDVNQAVRATLSAFLTAFSTQLSGCVIDLS